LRIFIALDIDDEIRGRICTFMEGVRGFAPDAGWVRPESLHVTLKFIGERPAQAVAQIKQKLVSVPFAPIDMTFRGYGFFPTPKSPRVFWVGLEASAELQQLASSIDEAMAGLGIPKEDHAFSPHLTLARRRGGSGSPRKKKGDGPHEGFQRLQEKLTAMVTPEFGTMTAREFFLYESQLSRSGARYTKLERFPMREASSASAGGLHHP
jgi:2'-5' RNA ligase